MAEKIRVLIVDDSALMREALKQILLSDASIEVVGMARDGKEGAEKALTLKPDVITMDLKMPVMNGIEAIETIMEKRPVPIIVVSSMDARVIASALSIGAMDFVPVTEEIDQIAKGLIRKIKTASRVKPLRRIRIKPLPKAPAPGKKKITDKIIAIGISTGGPQALQVLLSLLPANLPAGILIVQHISNGFIHGMAEWLRATSHVDIKVAAAGDVLKSGTVYFAPDDYHMTIDEGGVIGLKEDTADKRVHIPSIDVMMNSVAASFGENAIGVIMTGMGRDGVEGIKAINKSGGTTIAQDEKTSVIYGMNKLAVDAGYIDKIVALEDMGKELVKLL